MIHPSGMLMTALALFLTMLPGTRLDAAGYRLENWSTGLDLPWSIAFLPDGSALVTELGGRLWRLDASGEAIGRIENVPDVYFAGQGGLFDVVLHPRFEENGLVYLSFAEGGKADNGTAIARGPTLDGPFVAGPERQLPVKRGDNLQRAEQGRHSGHQ